MEAEDEYYQDDLEMEVSAVTSSSSSNQTTSTHKVLPWVEKYRPEKMDEISHQNEIIKALQSSIQIGNIPHLLFHGPPGTGKTTTVLALAHALYGPLYRSRILELNASDERGIKVVREKIKNFAQYSVSNKKIDGYPCPRFKLVILDEADTMTTDAQAALRRIIENYSKVTRFILLCNYVTRLIEPLASRCIKFRFQLLPSISIQSRINYIIDQEKVKIDDETLNYLLIKCQGDMRRTINVLQLSHSLTLSTGIITKNLINEIIGEISDDLLDKIWKIIIQDSKYNYDKLNELVDDIILEGYSLNILLEKIITSLLNKYNNKDILFNNNLNDIKISLICEKISEIEKKLIDGSTEYLQFLDLISYISRVIHDNITI